MVVPSGKKVELVSLVMEADCREEKGFTSIIENEQGEGDRLEKGGSVEVEKVEKENEIQASLSREVPSDAIAGGTTEEAVQNSPFPPEVPLLHEVLRIPPGQSVPLAQPEEEEEDLCEDGEVLLAKAETGPELAGDVIISKELPEACGPDLLKDRRVKLVFGPDDDSQCDSKEMVNNSDEGGEEEEELILSSNFVDTISEKSREEEVSSFLPPLTMTTPLKSWEVPRPLVTSTPATVAGNNCHLTP